MEKNYNVDDILSEIKKRKSQERPGAVQDSSAPGSTKGGSEEKRFHTSYQGRGDGGDTIPQDFHFSPPEDEPERPYRERPHRSEPPAARDDFNFTMPVGAESEKGKRQNPMEFTGHVRSIQDKAKMRPSRLVSQGQRPAAQPQFDFQPVDEPKRQSKPVDFSAFRADDATRDHTRVLPKFPTSQDLDEEDLKKNGIGAAAADDYDNSYYDDEEEYLQGGLPEHSAIDFSEYNSVKDRRDVATDIAKVKLWLFIRMSLTAILTLLTFWFAVSGDYVVLIDLPNAVRPVPETMRAYMLVCTVLTVLVAIVNSSAMGGGLISLFRMRANSDTLAALAVLASTAQCVMGAVKPEAVDPTQLNLYFCIAALSMLCGAIGKMTMINRIQTNFRVIASDKKKKALQAVDSDEFCREFVPEATRRPTIAYAVRADFFTDFLGLSYSDKYDVGINRSVAPVCLLGAVIVGIACLLLTGDGHSAVSALTAILCVSATLSATFIENIPLGKLTKKLAPLGGMVCNKAVEDFCDTAALILTENDLFPEGNVLLRGLKSIAQGRIDEAILDAASVICSLEGDLSPVFLQMIGGNRKLLKKVDNIVCENGMGISAWVDSRRVLIGNRLLMQNHSITMPPDAGVKQGHISAPEDGEMLYVANSGQVSAQFAVSYHIDNDLAAQLDLLATQEKSIIVYSCDANVTAHRIWELYGYPEELIRVLPAERHTQYRRMAEPRENAIAEIVYTGRAPAMVAAIVACINARSSILTATMVQLAQIVLGYGLVAFMAFMGAIGSLSIGFMCFYQILWFLVIFVIQQAKHP